MDASNEALRVPQGSKLYDVPGDGSCLFHAVYITFYKSRRGVLIPPSNALVRASKLLREATIKYLLLHYNRPVAKVQGNPTGRELIALEYGSDPTVPVRGPKTYLEYMRRTTTFGGETELYALSGLLKVAIAVHRVDANRENIVYFNTCQSPEDRAARRNIDCFTVLHVLFDPRSKHYMAII